MQPASLLAVPYDKQGHRLPGNQSRVCTIPRQYARL